MSKPKVLVAMSGGVDSSVAAFLLQKQGYEVVGITFQLYDYARQNRKEGKGGCCSLEDVTDARSVCIKLGIKHFLFDSRERFQKRVVDYFTTSYKQGLTPNPCVACNTFIKFDELEYYANEIGADYYATGHYARVIQDKGLYFIEAAADPLKDQSYFLMGVGQDKLRRLLFPLADYTKEQIRQIATDLGLVVSQKPDSMEVCFIPENNYRKFLKEEGAVSEKVGDVVDEAGRVLAQHTGFHEFTVGQKKGLGPLGLHHYYVIRVEAETNRVIVGEERALLSEGLVFSPTQLAYTPDVLSRRRLSVKIRSRAKPVEVEVLAPSGKNSELRLRFSEPQRAVTPGQFAVLYEGNRLIGGGPILEPVRTYAA